LRTRYTRLGGFIVLMRRRRSSHQKGVAFSKQRVASLVQSTDCRHLKGGCTEQVQSTDPSDKWQARRRIFSATRDPEKSRPGLRRASDRNVMAALPLPKDAESRAQVQMFYGSEECNPSDLTVKALSP
jgi:hypothetical protein